MNSCLFPHKRHMSGHSALISLLSRSRSKSTVEFGKCKCKTVCLKKQKRKKIYTLVQKDKGGMLKASNANCEELKTVDDSLVKRYITAAQMRLTSQKTQN